MKNPVKMLFITAAVAPIYRQIDGQTRNNFTIYVLYTDYWLINRFL